MVLREAPELLFYMVTWCGQGRTMQNGAIAWEDEGRERWFIHAGNSSNQRD